VRHQQKVRGACAEKTPRPAVPIDLDLHGGQQLRGALDLVEGHPLRAGHERGRVASGHLEGGELIHRPIVAVNPGLDAIRADLTSPDTSLAEANRSIILSRFGSTRYAEILAGIYRAVIDEPVRHGIDRGALLDCYLSPGRFRMLEQR
jgi:hypothetical protein